VIAVELAGAGLAGVTLADASAGYLDAARRHLACHSERSRLSFSSHFALAKWSACGCEESLLFLVRRLYVICPRFSPRTLPPERMASVLEAAGFVRAAWHNAPVGARSLPPPLIIQA
jgi:hypothetical protein